MIIIKKLANGSLTLFKRFEGVGVGVDKGALDDGDRLADDFDDERVVFAAQHIGGFKHWLIP